MSIFGVTFWVSAQVNRVGFIKIFKYSVHQDSRIY